MSKFEKDNFEYFGGYLHYLIGGHTMDCERKFVARFKHRGPVTKGKFVAVLKKHYSVEDYFAKLDAGRAPLQILEEDGHLVFHPSADGKRAFFVLCGKVL